MLGKYYITFIPLLLNVNAKTLNNTLTVDYTIQCSLYDNITAETVIQNFTNSNFTINANCKFNLDEGSKDIQWSNLTTIGTICNECYNKTNNGKVTIARKKCMHVDLGFAYDPEYKIINQSCSSVIFPKLQTSPYVQCKINVACLKLHSRNYVQAVVLQTCLGKDEKICFGRQRNNCTNDTQIATGSTKTLPNGNITYYKPLSCFISTTRKLNATLKSIGNNSTLAIITTKASSKETHMLNLHVVTIALVTSLTVITIAVTVIVVIVYINIRNARKQCHEKETKTESETREIETESRNGSKSYAEINNYRYDNYNNDDVANGFSFLTSESSSSFYFSTDNKVLFADLYAVPRKQTENKDNKSSSLKGSLSAKRLSENDNSLSVKELCITKL